MSQEFTTAIGRFLWGSMYEAQTKSFDGTPYTIKTPGPDFGKPAPRFQFGVAIPKGTEKQWWDTTWGKIIAAEGMTFPGNAAQRPDFAWKITDGDSTLAKKGSTQAINTKVGYAGHWVLSFSSSYPPKLFISDGNGGFKQLVEPNFIKRGYYVQVNGSVACNGNTNNPGIFLNHNMVCFSAYGDEIQGGGDPMAAGFGGALPAGASAAPVGGSFAPAAGTPALPAVPGAVTMPAVPGAPAAPALPQTPAPVAATPVLVQVPGAQYTIEACRTAGWTDQQIVDNGVGRWETPAPAAPALPAVPGAPAATGVTPVPSFLNGPPVA